MAADREQVTRYLYSHPEIFGVRLIPVPAELDRDDLRLTVAHDEDWEHLHTIYDALGPERFDWRGIADLLHQHPSVRERHGAFEPRAGCARSDQELKERVALLFAEDQ